jgi:hypothetical protein
VNAEITIQITAEIAADAALLESVLTVTTLASITEVAGVTLDSRIPSRGRLGASPTPYTPPEIPEGKANLTDPDSRLLNSTRGYNRATTPRPPSTRGRS